MKLVVNILNEKMETVKTIDGFESYKHAYEFAKSESTWRGWFVQIAAIESGKVMQDCFIKA